MKTPVRWGTDRRTDLQRKTTFKLWLYPKSWQKAGQMGCKIPSPRSRRHTRRGTCTLTKSSAGILDWTHKIPWKGDRLLLWTSARPRWSSCRWQCITHCQRRQWRAVCICHRIQRCWCLYQPVHKSHKTRNSPEQPRYFILGNIKQYTEYSRNDVW